jgi:hypothetical protein
LTGTVGAAALGAAAAGTGRVGADETGTGTVNCSSPDAGELPVPPDALSMATKYLPVRATTVNRRALSERTIR